MSRGLRAWQRTALNAYVARRPRDFLTVATPGAGKTTFALHVAGSLLLNGEIDQVVVVAPTEHLKHQWADAAAAIGIPLDPEFSNTVGRTTPDFRGVVVTYAQVGLAPEVHKRGVEGGKTLVILDEVHHAGDNLSWGDGVREAYSGATRRLSLSGTPFRSDVNPIAFLRYEQDADGALRSVADFTYGYADALRDQVVRPVVFLAYSGQARWLDASGQETSAALGEPLTKDATARAWRTALDPAGDWIPSVLEAADRRLSQVRADMPDAGGLVIASHQKHARAYAKLLAQISGEQPTVVLSDDPGASDKIAEFAGSDARWMVAVRMVSEGVDVPRLGVGVYATNVSAALFFTQAVGRFVRARRPGETASLFLPAVPPLMRLAAQLERERDHVLQPAQDAEDGELDDAALEEANRLQKYADPDAATFKALEASAHLDRLIYNGDEFGAPAEIGSSAETQFLELPTLVDADEIARLLSERAAAQMAFDGSGGGAGEPVERVLPLHRQVSDARRELQGLVGSYHHRTGTPHPVIHAQLRNYCGGPATAEATLEELRTRIASIRSWP